MGVNHEHFHQVDKVLKYQPCFFLFFFFPFGLKILSLLRGGAAGC